jgi:hypothetical protein
LRYKRNTNKDDVTLVVSEKQGTCGTKHGFLKLLLDEHQINASLLIGYIKMNSHTMPAVKVRLEAAGIDYIPEAHNFLRINGQILDCTTPSFGPHIYENYLLAEEEVEPHQMGEYKVSRHRLFLDKWLGGNPQITLDRDALWLLREACIGDLEKGGF